ncbi:MAG TPA: adenylate/guanylate cyclase domain-containing protein, partial [Thermodesulfobacteriota bacterium]|nr:adenylate/guanylate cyclase domain-containing protein [Thermodesulfobacteriota bacterium]
LVGDTFMLREVDMVQVVGRVQPVRIYELLGAHGVSLPHEQEQAFSFYASGLEAYRKRSWNEALNFFIHGMSLWPCDGPSRTMAERCQIYQKTPPPEEWDGVFEAIHKFK